jgi:LPS export ABC transporter protein LptC
MVYQNAVPLINTVQQRSTSLRSFSFFFFLLGISLLFSCKNDLDKVRVDLGDKIPLAITKEFISLYSDSGKVVLQIEAPLRKDYSTNGDFYSELPEGIKLTFFDRTKRVIALLNADYALIKGTGMFIQGNINMESTKNGTLKTESLFWNSEKKEITTADAIEIRQERKVIYGQGLWARQDFSEYTILVPTGTIPITDR